MKTTKRDTLNLIASEMTSNAIEDIKLQVYNPIAMARLAEYLTIESALQTVAKMYITRFTKDSMTRKELSDMRKYVKNKVGLTEFTKANKSYKSLLKDYFTSFLCSETELRTGYGFNISSKNLDKVRYACLSIRRGKVNYNEFTAILELLMRKYLNAEIMEQLDNKYIQILSEDYKFVLYEEEEKKD